MSFIQRELEKIERTLHEPQYKDQYDQLYAAQQALGWALDPTCFRSPYNMIMGIPVDSTDCLDLPPLEQS